MAQAKKKTQQPTTSLDSLIKVFIVTTLVIFPLGFVVGDSLSTADTTESTEDTHLHIDDTADTGDSAHMHEAYEVSDIDNAPQITNFKVAKDKKSGWNISFDTENFKFTPENASGAHVDGEGHAHIYVDGNKIGRVYSNNFHLDTLSEGSHTVFVTLNTNDHKEYTVSGENVGASQLVADTHHTDEKVADESDDSHSHDENEPGHSH